MFDIFYTGPKPNLFAHERECTDIEHARELSGTRFFWIVNYLTDYTGFDFLWEPVPWEAGQQHVWPSQHQANGGTRLVPKQGSADVNRGHAIVPRVHSVPKLGIDHGQGINCDCLLTTRFIGDYLGTLRRMLKHIDDEYVWVISSVCDYSNFDFTWHPSEWQAEMLHVFPSDDQQFGDTFYIHVPTFLERSKDIRLLEWYDTINFVADRPVPRLPIPQVHHNNDSHPQAVWQHEFQDPIVEFVTGPDRPLGPRPAVNLWREEVRAITPLTPGSSRVLVPRDAKNYPIQRQLYGYPNIDRSHIVAQDDPIDIIFLSNGEEGADSNYEFLKIYSKENKNRLVRIDGITGRVASQHAAASASRTPWYFLVPAKLRINVNFDWSWQPDRLQEPKHYIFYARNAITGLEYGHMATVAYNRDLVLATTGTGLDFTLDQPHEIVPRLSGLAYLESSPWITWRTAFRECIKLRHSLPNIENEYRLNQWLTTNKIGPAGEWSIRGAQDAVDYYEEVNGDFAALKKTYEWSWLATYASLKYDFSSQV